MFFQEGPPVCWLFLPGRLFVGWSVLIGKTLGWPISWSIVTAASDKVRPASRKPEIYPPAFHHSFTISAQRETERKRGSTRGITGKWINKNHMGSIQIIKCTQKNMCTPSMYMCMHKPVKTHTYTALHSLTSSLWHMQTHTHSNHNIFLSRLFNPRPPSHIASVQHLKLIVTNIIFT